MINSASLTPVDGVSIQPGWRSRLKAAKGELKSLERLRQTHRGRLHVGAVSQVTPGPIPFLNANDK